MNENQVIEKTKKRPLLIKKCHCCGHISEGEREAQRCGNCHKSFMPSQYFNKVHAKNSAEYKELFSFSDELHESDLIKGMAVLWSDEKL